MLTEQDVKDFFARLEKEAETEAEKGIAIAGNFLRSTYAALAKDPVLTAAIQAGFSTALAAVAGAVETGGTSVLAGAALAAGRALVVSCGATAEHELVPIVAGELQAALATATAATPEHVNN